MNEQPEQQMDGFLQKDFIASKKQNRRDFDSERPSVRTQGQGQGQEPGQGRGKERKPIQGQGVFVRDGIFSFADYNSTRMNVVVFVVYLFHDGITHESSGAIKLIFLPGMTSHE